MVPPTQFGTFHSGVSDSEVPPPKNRTPIIASPPSRMSPSSCRASIGSNDRDAPFPHIPPTTQQTTRACMEKAMTVWGWTFDAFLIIVNLTDVVSDCLIARQFWVDGHKTFFWLVIVSLAIASFIYTFVGVEYLLRERMHNKLPRVIQYPVMLILSQLVPVMNWLLELLMPQANVTNGVAGWSNTFGVERSEFATGVAAQEIGSMQNSAYVMERLDFALAKHLRSHALLYVESVVEAIPQSIVQLLAVSFLGEASPLQVFSLALSMISIMSKGYVLSRSFALPEIVFKFFLGCYDLFSLFYIFATVFSNMSSPDIEIGGGLYVDYLSFVWMMKLLAFWGYVALGASVIGIYSLKHSIGSGTMCRVRLVGEMIGAFFLGVLALGPGIIAIEGGKLLWLNFFLTENEPPTTLFPALSLWYGFCNGAPTMNEFYNRFRYISLRLIDQTLSVQEVHSRGQVQSKRRKQKETNIPITTNEEESASRAQQRAEHNAAATVSSSAAARNVWIARRAQPIRKIVKNPPHHVAVILPLLTAPKFRPWEIMKALHWNRFWKSSSDFNEKLLMAAIIICGAVYAIGQLFSLAFPFLHFIIYRGHQNLLQCFCFYGAAGTMFVIICLAPRICRFVLFLGMSYYTARTMLSPQTGSQTIESLIEDYFIPQPAHFIANEVDPELLPADLVGVVASFLRREDLDLRAITVEDCRNVSNNMIMNNLSIDVPCTGPDAISTDANGMQTLLNASPDDLGSPSKN